QPTFIAIHLDYGLKGGPQDYSNINGNATLCQTTSPTIIGSTQAYNFEVGGAVIIPSSPVITSENGFQNQNVFKKNPGVGGFVGHGANLDDLQPISGVTVRLSSSQNGPAITPDVVTDADGWYMFNYKWTGKGTTLYVRLISAGVTTPTIL